MKGNRVCFIGYSLEYIVIIMLSLFVDVVQQLIHFFADSELSLETWGTGQTMKWRVN